MLRRVLWYCHELTRNEWLSPKDLRALREKRLRAIVKHAYENVPLYRQKFNSVGVRPEDVRTTEDLGRLPFTSKEEIWAGMPDSSMAKGYRIEDCVRMPTSGTTGGPMVALRDKRYWDYCVANSYYRRTRSIGVSPLSKSVRIYYHRGDTNPTEDRARRDVGGEARSRGRIALGPSIPLFKHWVKKVYIAYTGDEVISDIVKFAPRMIYANASYLRLLAETVADRGIDTVRPQALVSWGEVLDEPTRKYLETSFRCDVFDSYGANEVGPLAWECKRKEGYHIVADFSVLEIVRDGEQAGAGERGGIVVTSLLNYAMPMVRYRVGDMGMLREGLCSCGRGFSLLESIEGRIVDCFRSGDGTLVSPKIVQSAIQGISGVSRYQIIQQSANKVTVEIMRKKSDPEVSADELISRLRVVLGDEVNVEVFFSDRTDLKAKFRPVISKLSVNQELRWTKPRAGGA